MRYFETRKRYRIIKNIKILLSVVLTSALSIVTMRIFGEDITKSAYSFTFGRNPANNKQAYYAKSSFEDDFLTFVDFGQTEQEKQSDTTPSDTNSSAVTVNMSAVSGKYTNYNGTSFINNTDYNITSLLYAGYTKPKINKDAPYILIYHTHTSEEYYGGGTVVDVGNAMAKEFEALGYKTIHITDVYDKEQFSGAYSRSINGVTSALQKYPEIKLVFDVHRDSITAADGTQYRPVTTIDGQECAQVMLVCGTDSKGLTHPNWRENFKFGLDVSRTMYKEYGALSRPVNLRRDRFNTHVTNYTLLLEVGSDANTLEEATRAAVYTARSIVKTIEK